MTITPPVSLLTRYPDSQPVEVTEDEYEATLKRIRDQHGREWSEERILDHLAYVLCGHPRPSNMPASAKPDAGQTLISTHAELLRVVRDASTRQTKDMRDALDLQNAVIVGLTSQTRESGELVRAGSDIVGRAIESEMSGMRESLGATFALASSAFHDGQQMQAEAMDRFGRDLIGHLRRSAWRMRKDRWIQTGIIAAPLIAGAAALWWRG
jgi:hypothetical protein